MELSARTVGRDELIATVVRRLRTAATTGNRPHTLLVGPRGAGKSHLIRVALHRLGPEPGLVVAELDEDVVGLASYADILIEIHRRLAAPTAGYPGRDVAQLERRILELAGSRVIVLVIENLPRAFEAIGLDGQRDLRSFMETSGQIVILASAPLLFPAVSDRKEPWYGSFGIEHLPELDVTEGAELIRRISVANHETELPAYLQTEAGIARLSALNVLAGGSPRLWTIMSTCLNIELLDDLVVAVEQLLENLVTYYQQRLWELPSAEAQIVRALALGPQSTTARELARQTGRDERTTASLLGRLIDAGWVTSEKLPGTDQRKTWYRLREPLLRHHFQYRGQEREPLRLIIDILRAWFDPGTRRQQLLSTRPSSQAERHLIASMRLDPPERSDAPYAAGDLRDLLRYAKTWQMDGGDELGTPSAGLIIEALCIALLDGPPRAYQLLDTRNAAPDVRSRAEQVIRVVTAEQPSLSLEDRVLVALDAAVAASVDTDDYRVLALIAAGWNANEDPPTKCERLAAIDEPGKVDRLSLAIRHDLLLWLSEAERHRDAISRYPGLIAAERERLGPEHPDVLESLETYAFALYMCDMDQAAAETYAECVAVLTKALGPDNRRTLQARMWEADALGYSKEFDRALNALSAIISEQARVLGREHPDVLHSRKLQASHLARAGRMADASDAFVSLIADRVAQYGPGDVETMEVRDRYARHLGWSGRFEEALAACEALIEDRVRILGPDHRDTLLSRHWQAFWLGRAGDHAKAIAAFEILILDQTRVLGPTDRDTLNSKSWLAMTLALLGSTEDIRLAISHLRELLSELVQEFGESDQDTLENRVDLARFLGAVGEYEEAVPMLVQSVDDCLRSTLPRQEDLRYASSALMDILVASLRDGQPLPVRSELGLFGESNVYDMLRDFADGLAGSGEALARLPGELRSLIDKPR
ncbi:MAG: tetratricopeptide repeat protein [Jatrophihabitantaceae bacterium]